MQCPNCGFNMPGEKCLHCGYTNKTSFSNGNQQSTPSRRKLSQEKIKKIKEKKENHNKISNHWNTIIAASFLLIMGISMIILGPFTTMDDSSTNQLNSEKYYNMEKTIKLEKSSMKTDNFTITATSLKETHYAYYLNLKIDNKSSTSQRIYIASMNLNNIHFDEYKTIEIGSNSTTEETITIYPSELENVKINDITDIKLNISYYLENNTKSEKEQLLIKTENYGKHKQKYNLGRKIYEDENISIQFVKMTGYSNSSIELLNQIKNIKLFIKNKSNNTLKLTPKNSYIKVNQEETKVNLEEYIDANTYQLVELTLTSDVELDNINSVIFGLKYNIVNDYKNYKVTNDIELKIKKSEKGEET